MKHYRRFTDNTVNEFLKRNGDQCAYRPRARIRGFLVIAAAVGLGLFLVLPNLLDLQSYTSGGPGGLPAAPWPPTAIRWLLLLAFGLVMVFGAWIHRTCALALLLFHALWWGDPKQTFVIFIFILSALYVLIVFFRLFSVLAGMLFSGTVKVKPEHISAWPEDDWPVYTVLIPLYKEPEVAAIIIRAIKNLDYPPDKLDVKLLIESDDVTTREALEELRLPDYVEVVVVPEDSTAPKCKPRACNHGLAGARGKYLVIYDAEDRPEPDQLKKAVVAFESVPDNVICFQAKLNYFNPHQNLLTALFTIEYTTWFDFYLPGLHAMRSPIPLGGTSNHFKTAALKELAGWDPFNVTEDCDLGLRLWRQGFRTRILDSTTWEEANSRLGNWFRQRSRWIKGYLQTHLVHTRDIPRLVFGRSTRNLLFRLFRGGKSSSERKGRENREKGLGLYGAITGTMTVGGLTLLLALNPLFWFIGGLYLERDNAAELFEPGASLGEFDSSEKIRKFLAEDWQLVYYNSKTIPERRISIYRDPPEARRDLDDWAYLSQLFYPCVAGLVLANGLFILISALACLKRGYWRLLPVCIVIPFYWILISLAAWKGILQLLTRPFYWEKTRHGLAGESPDKEDVWMPTGTG